jgi:hypothetical protein
MKVLVGAGRARLTRPRPNLTKGSIQAPAQRVPCDAGSVARGYPVRAFPRRSLTSDSESGTSNSFCLAVAPETSTTSRPGRSSARARSFATAALAAPSAGAAVTRTFRVPPASNPSIPSRDARGVTRTGIRVTVCRLPPVQPDHTSKANARTFVCYCVGCMITGSQGERQPELGDGERNG